jgi:hypothetical protein
MISTSPKLIGALKSLTLPRKINCATKCVDDAFSQYHNNNIANHCHL